MSTQPGTAPAKTAAAMYAGSFAPDAQQRESLILEHLPQVRLIARRIHERLPGTVCMDDLISAGTLGLIAAVDHYDPTQNVKLKTYAEHRIRGAILDALRGLDWAPRQRRRMSRDIETAIATLEQRLGRSPAEDEIAAELRIPLADYHQRLLDTEGLKIGELEFSGSDESSDRLVYQLEDKQESPSQLLERAELEKIVTLAIDRMPHAERMVLSLYYHEELSLREIAGILEVHMSRVSQLKTQAILRLRVLMQQRWPATGARRIDGFNG